MSPSELKTPVPRTDCIRKFCSSPEVEFDVDVEEKGEDEMGTRLKEGMPTFLKVLELGG